MREQKRTQVTKKSVKGGTSKRKVGWATKYKKEPTIPQKPTTPFYPQRPTYYIDGTTLSLLNEIFKTGGSRRCWLHVIDFPNSYYN